MGRIQSDKRSEPGSGCSLASRGGPHDHAQDLASHHGGRPGVVPRRTRYELHAGVLHISGPQIAWHSDVMLRIANVLERLGMEVGCIVGVRFGDNDTRAPDVAVFK